LLLLKQLIIQQQRECRMPNPKPQGVASARCSGKMYSKCCLCAACCIACSCISQRSATQPFGCALCVCMYVYVCICRCVCMFGACMRAECGCMYCICERRHSTLCVWCNYSAAACVSRAFDSAWCMHLHCSASYTQVCVFVPPHTQTACLQPPYTARIHTYIHAFIYIYMQLPYAFTGLQQGQWVLCLVDAHCRQLCSRSCY
jgi:hypothetical protein